MKRILQVLPALMLVLSSILALTTSASAQTPISPPTSAKFTALGSYSIIYSRYYSGNVLAGILKMTVQPSGPTIDTYCIDLYTPISFGNTLIANGDLSEATQLGSINWCAVNYILYNYDYQTSYTGGHPLAGLTQNQRAATIQAAIWYFVTAPYGPYTGVSGAKYQFMTDPTNTTNFDAKPLRTRAMALVGAAIDGCDNGFRYPTSINLTPEIDADGCGNITLTAMVYDQNDNAVQNMTVSFTTDHGTLNPTSGTTDSNGEVQTTLTLSGPYTAIVQAYVEGTYGSLLYDPANTKQALTTLTLLPYSIADKSTIICEPEPAIDVEKYVGTSSEGPWYDADIEPGLLVPGGEAVYFKFVMNNTGNVDLYEVVLWDDGTPITLTGLTDEDGDSTPDDLGVGASAMNITGPVTATPGPNGPNKDTATANGTYNVTTVSDTDDAYYTPTYKKSGTVYYDDNGNGTQDPGELGIPYVTVLLCLGCPVEEAYPCNTIAIIVTDADGYYEFGNVPACSADPDECYVVSIPSMTDDTTDFNDKLYLFDVVENDKVKFNEAVGRACIRFNLLDDEPNNNFGYYQMKAPVGGDAYPVNKATLIAPWVALALATVATAILLVRRRIHV